MNNLETIRKQIIKKTRLHEAQLICVAQPNQRKYTKIMTNAKGVNF